MYMSRGTVRATISWNGNSWDRGVYFIPTPDYSFKHEKGQFAVFVSKSGDDIHHVPLAECISLKCSASLFNVATIAAVTQVQVEVEVKKSTEKCEVIGITIPAK